MKAKFFRCAHCGNVITMLEDKGVPVVCCGEPMQELVANKEDAAVEKHVPFVEVDDDEIEVTIGETIHPMEEEHHIQFIYLETDKGGMFKKLAAGDEPKAKFEVEEGKPVAVYELCNLHGLWVKEL